MSYVDQWNAIAARIRSLHNAADLYAQLAIGSRMGDSGFVGGVAATTILAKHCRSIFYEIEGFRQIFRATLPWAANACLDRFLDREPGDELFRNEISRVKFGPVVLTAFEAEMSFHLSDVQEILRARSERAFLHLQRLLAVDAELQNKWKTAFEKDRAGEVSCERLGAVHLLWHGIFAFKVHAQGAHTDLVFEEPIDVSAATQRGIEGLVLTEWKVADEGDAVKRFEEARDQAEKYRQGVLAGTELTGYRYAVVVSRKDLPKGKVPNDTTIGGVVYRHINIAIEPRSPSVQARAK